MLLLFRQSIQFSVEGQSPALVAGFGCLGFRVQQSPWANRRISAATRKPVRPVRAESAQRGLPNSSGFVGPRPIPKQATTGCCGSVRAVKRFSAFGATSRSAAFAGIG
jgi:hypothetical protein